MTTIEAVSPGEDVGRDTISRFDMQFQAAAFEALGYQAIREQINQCTWENREHMLEIWFNNSHPMHSNKKSA